MQDRFDEIEAALTGSVTILFQADAWYDGELVTSLRPDADEPGPVLLGGSIDADTTRGVLTTGETIAGSTDGSAAPSGYGSALACYGSELNIRAALDTGSDPIWFSLGWFRIDDYDTDEWYQPYRMPSGEETWVSRGLRVTNSLSDRWVNLDDADFLAPAQPAGTSSVKAEIVRVVDGLVPIADWSDIPDLALPTSYAYDTKRSTTVQGLAGLLSCVPYMNPDGALDLRSTTPATTPAWRVTVGSDGVDAPLLAWSRKGDRAGIYNGVVSTGQAADGTPTSGQALEPSGPLRWGGPFGRVPYNHSDATLSLNSACQSDAVAQLATLAKQRTVTIPVTLPWNPAFEAFDVLQLTLPDRVLTGPAVSLSRPLTAGPMTASVAIPRDDLWGLVGGS